MGTRVLLTILLPALGVATLSLSLVAIPDVSLMAELGRDAIVRASTRWPPAAPGDLPDVAIVAIDGQSLQALPDWPWPREYFTRMISDLDDAGARAIAFDIDFSTPRDPDQDRELAATIASSEKVVLGAFHEFELIPNVGEIERAVFPTPQLAAGATLSASMVPLDPDGRVRRARASTEIGGRALPSMALAALETAVQPDRHVEQGEPFAIDYRRAFPPPTILSAIDLIEGRLDPGDVQGKVVLVGATAPILQDLWSTPMGHSVPGVLIQATEYRHHAAVMAGLPVLVRAGLPAQAALVTLAAVLSLSVGGTGRRRRLGISAVGVALLPFQILLCVSSGWLLEPVSPLAAVLLSYLLRLERIHIEISRLLRQRERSLGAFLRIGRIAADRLGPAQAEVALGAQQGKRDGRKAGGFAVGGAEPELGALCRGPGREGRGLHLVEIDDEVLGPLADELSGGVAQGAARRDEGETALGHHHHPAPDPLEFHDLGPAPQSPSIQAQVVRPQTSAEPGKVDHLQIQLRNLHPQLPLIFIPVQGQESVDSFHPLGLFRDRREIGSLGDHRAYRTSGRKAYRVGGGKAYREGGGKAYRRGKERHRNEDHSGAEVQHGGHFRSPWVWLCPEERLSPDGQSIELRVGFPTAMLGWVSSLC